MKLFVIYIGGKTANSNIELHDMRFAVGEELTDCYDELRHNWWGTAESLHIDCWGALEHADGYDISLSPTPYTGKEKLYFVNLGGYDLQEFTELHKNVFVVAENESKAKVKALRQILHWDAHHKDHQLEIEQTICLHEAMLSRNMHLHLEKSSEEKEFHFVCKYMPISKSSEC